MDNFRPYKFLIVAVIQRTDENGEVVEEMQREQPESVFGIAGLHAYADKFELELAAAIPVRKEDFDARR